MQDIASQVYIVDAITLARIKDTKLFRETLGADLVQAEARVAARLDSALRQTYGRRSFDAALSSDRAVMMREIRDELRKEADTFGIEIVDVRVRRTDLNENVLEQTYRRMESERNALAADIRSKGEATKTRMNAETDRTYTTKLADAQRQSEIIRGEGDGERNKVFAQAFQQDPEFFSFYRSMQAYTKSMGADGTTMVLNPDSEFFKYFGFEKNSGTAAPAAPAAMTQDLLMALGLVFVIEGLLYALVPGHLKNMMKAMESVADDDAPHGRPGRPGLWGFHGLGGKSVFCLRTFGRRFT